MPEKVELKVPLRDARIYGIAAPHPALLGRRASAYILDAVGGIGGTDSMAKVPVLINSQPLNAAAAAMEAAAKGRGGLVSRTVKALASYVAVDQAFEHAPEAYNSAVEYFAKSGADVHELAVSDNKVVQSTVVDVLFKKGLPVSLIENAGLSAKELKTYANVLQRYRNTADATIADVQAAGATTGNEELDRIAKNLDIEKICRGLGISSDLYAALLRGINTHVHSDIEAFQLHRRMYNMQAI